MVTKNALCVALQEHNMKEVATEGTHQITSVSKFGFSRRGRGGFSGGGGSVRGGGGGVRGGGRGYRPGRGGMLPVYGAAAGAGTAAAATHGRHQDIHRGSAPQTSPSTFSTFPVFLLSVGVFLVNF